MSDCQHGRDENNVVRRRFNPQRDGHSSRAERHVHQAGGIASRYITKSPWAGPSTALPICNVDHCLVIDKGKEISSGFFTYSLKVKVSYLFSVFPQIFSSYKRCFTITFNPLAQAFHCVIPL